MVAVAPCCVFVISVRCSLRVCHLFLKRIISLSIPLPLHLRLLSHYYTSSSLSFRMTIHHFCFPLLRSPIYFVSFQHRKCPHFSSEDFIFFFLIFRSLGTSGCRRTMIFYLKSFPEIFDSRLSSFAVGRMYLMK